MIILRQKLYSLKSSEKYKKDEQEQDKIEELKKLQLDKDPEIRKAADKEIMKYKAKKAAEITGGLALGSGLARYSYGRFGGSNRKKALKSSLKFAGLGALTGATFEGVGLGAQAIFNKRKNKKLDKKEEK